MAEIVRQETLHNTLPGHSKQYVMRIERDGRGYSLVAEWGRIGATNLQSKVYVEGGSLASAEAMWDRLHFEKIGKGYEEVGSRRNVTRQSVYLPPRPERLEPEPAPRPRPKPAAQKPADAGEYVRKIRL